MRVNITSEELKIILDKTPSEQNIMLVGKHGIGKSKIITEYFSKKKIKVVSLFLGQMSDPGDLIGLPHKDEKTQKTNFMPPFWFPIDDEPIVLFLDELNRARPEILQTIMDLTLNKKLAGKSLPKGSRVISAVNDGEEYQLTDLDPALVSRFNVYNFTPTASEWLVWANKNKIDKRIIEFIKENPRELDSYNEEGLEKTPDRRAWVRVSDILKNLPDDDILLKKVLSGIIGVASSVKFVDYFSNNEQLVSADLLMRDFKKYISKVKKYDIAKLSLVNENVFKFFETSSYKDGEKELVKNNLFNFVDYLSKEKSKEKMAHFISIFEHTSYPKTNLLIMTEIPKLYKKITDFIKNL